MFRSACFVLFCNRNAFAWTAIPPRPLMFELACSKILLFTLLAMPRVLCVRVKHRLRRLV